MAKNKRDPEEKIDPRVLELLETLRPTPPRDPQEEQRTRARFLEELAATPLARPSGTPWSFFSRQRKNSPTEMHEKKDLIMSTRKTPFSFSTIAVFILILGFLLGGTGMTALAAQSALPGDALYPVKTSLERTRISLARDAADRAQLQMTFAEQRLIEIGALISEGRFGNITTATQEFENHIRLALAEIDVILEGDPVRAAELMTQINSSLTRYAQTLAGMMANVPEPVRVEMERAMAAAQNAGGPTGQVEFSGVVENMDQGIWMIAGRPVTVNQQTEIKGIIGVGSLVKVHARQDAEGRLTAREIEPVGAAGGVGNENANENENTNDDNRNDNVNTNGNTNTNINTNTNTNTNGDNGNANLNSNTNTNTNTNTNMNNNDNDNDDDDDNGNANLNSNTNTNMNTNTNTNTNMNNNDNDNDDDDDDNDNDDDDDNDNDDDDDNDNDNGNG
jgi:hypothetical protein